jgi:uncharacterized protein
MTVELRPLGVKCNIRCQYCYQNPQRDAGNVSSSYDLEKMKAAVEAEGGDFTLFGGEPLLMPLSDLEALWEWGYERFGKNGIQTNGVLISEDHIALFKKFHVQIGISIDGPDDLNGARWAGSTARTNDATIKSQSAIERLCREGIVPSIIVTLHRENATSEKLLLMNDWFRRLEQIGITAVRLHALEVETQSVRENLALTEGELLGAFENFSELQRSLRRLKFDVFSDMRKLLIGDDNHTTCVWNACDPYTTRAVRGVEGSGQRSNCGRTNKDGIDFAKSDVQGFERYIALYHTPQEFGGCKGCRFFLVCKGQCPGTALEGDWRNRTEHCSVWKRLYEGLEKDMVKDGLLPLSQRSDLVQIEASFLESWSVGSNPMIESVLRTRRETEASLVRSSPS